MPRNNIVSRNEWQVSRPQSLQLDAAIVCSSQRSSPCAGSPCAAQIATWLHNIHLLLQVVLALCNIPLCADSPAFTTAWSWSGLTCWCCGTSTHGATRPYVSMAFLYHLPSNHLMNLAVQPSLDGCDTITPGITQLAGCPCLGWEVCGGGCWAQPP